MMRRFISLAFFISLSFTVLAQQQIEVKFLNQYEELLKEVTISNGGRDTIYQTDDRGIANILVNPSDSVKIHANGHATVITDITSLTQQSEVHLHKNFTWKDLLNPMFYIVNGGLWLLLFIVFAETGLFIGFFLPGDSLLFVAGIYSTNIMHEFFKEMGIAGINNEWVDLFLLVGLISFMGILGNSVGYWFGKKIGPAMFNWKDRFLFKKKYLHDAHDFFEKHGGGAIVFARFLPIIRTFAPIVAGIVDMSRKKFMFYNIVGCIAWVISMIFAGHFLQIWVRKQFGFELKDHLEVIVIIIVFVTTFPVLWKLIFGKKRKT